MFVLGEPNTASGRRLFAGHRRHAIAFDPPTREELGAVRQPVTNDRNLIPTRPKLDVHDDFISMFNERHGGTFTMRIGCGNARIVTRETRVSQGTVRIGLASSRVTEVVTEDS